MGAFQNCPRLRYLTYHYAGKGLQRRSLALPLINGDFVHLALARLLTQEPLDDVIQDLSSKYRDAVMVRGIQGVDTTFQINEQLCLLEGLVRAWDRVRKPSLLAEFEIADTPETEHEWELAPGIIVMVRMDAPLRRKRDGLLFIKDWKTTGGIYGPDWGLKYEHDSQILCYLSAAEAIFKEPIGGLLMEGILKGKRAIDKSSTSPFQGQRIQQSDLCYGFKVREKSTGLFFFERGWTKYGEKFPVWDMPGGIKEWLASEWSELDCQELFIPLPAIRPTKRELERWRRQMVHQEMAMFWEVEQVEGLRRIAVSTGTNMAWEAYDFALDAAFPQNRDYCYRYNGPCSMHDACFVEEVGEDPIASGLYQERVPHHSTEEEG